MAPEQFERPTEVDHRADIYSLGVVLYEMLTGELPLGRFQPPSERASVDARLDQVVLRTLEKEPDTRYQQASDVQTDLDQVRDSPDDGRQGATDGVGPASLGSVATATTAGMTWLGGVFGKFKETVEPIGVTWFCASPSQTAVAAKAASVTAILELLCGAFLAVAAFLESREFVEFIMLSLCCFLASGCCWIMSILLRHREYPGATLALAVLLPLSVTVLAIVRIPLAVWAFASLIRKSHRDGFASPVWEHSRTRTTLHGAFQIGRASASATATGAQSLAAESVQTLGHAVRSPPIRSTLSGFLTIACWTVACLLISLAVDICWTQVFAPKRWHLDDNSAQGISNPLGIRNFGITGSGTTIQPTPQLQTALTLKRVQFTANGASSREKPHRLSVDLDHGEPQCYDEEASGYVPLRRDHLRAWVEHAVAIGNGNVGKPSNPDSDDEGQAAALSSGELQEQLTDHCFGIVQQLHHTALTPTARRVETDEWFRTPTIASQRIVDLANAELFKVTRGRGIGVHRLHSPARYQTFSVIVTIWLFGVIVLVALIVRKLRRSPERQSVDLMHARWLFIVTSYASAVLAAFSYDGRQTNVPMRGTPVTTLVSVSGDFGDALAPEALMVQDSFGWWLSRTGLFYGLIVTSGLCLLCGLLVSKGWLKGVMKWAIAPLGIIGALTITTLFAIQFPWWHDWPMLIPIWMSLFCFVVYAWSAQRVL